METTSLRMLAEENSRLRLLVGQLAPSAIAWLRRMRPEPGSEAWLLLEALRNGEAVPPPAASLLPTLMSELSEEYWCAGWLIGCEYELWARVVQYRRTGNCSPWGLGRSAEFTGAIAALSELSESTGSWAVWGESAPEVVPIDTWKSGMWANAPEHCVVLAQSPPSCGEPGPVESSARGWPILTSFHLDIGHDGPPSFETA